jgi:hypothetical protein
VNPTVYPKSLPNHDPQQKFAVLFPLITEEIIPVFLLQQLECNIYSGGPEPEQQGMLLEEI